MYYHYGVVGFQNGEPILDPDSVGLWLADGDGGTPHLLLRGSSTYGDWAPTSDGIVYESLGKIYRAGIVGSVVDSLTIEQLTTFGSSYYPAWSFDGQWIAYDSDAASDGPFEIWVMAADGSNKRRIERTGMGEWRNPSWSPSQLICHVRYPADTDYSEVFTMDSNGGNAIRVTNNQREERLPRFSPDGARLTFCSVSQSESAVWVSNVDGSDAKKLARGVDPAWSPDGQWIAFSRSSSDPKLNGTIWKIRVDSGEEVQLTHGPQ